MKIEIKNNLNETDTAKVNNIIADLVARNMMNGSSLLKAKKQAFNRMMEPDNKKVFLAWLADNSNPFILSESNKTS